MADIGDFKESMPAPADTYSMPARDPSLDDFEKLENFCIQDKAESDIIPAFGHDLMAPVQPSESKLIGSFEKTPQPSFKSDDSFRSKQQQQEDEEEEEEDKDKFNTLSSPDPNDPFADLMEYSSRGSPQVTSSAAVSGSLLDFDIPAAPEPVITTRSIQPEEEDDFQEGFRAVEKLVHPQSAPSDSGYGPSPSDENAVGDESPVDDSRLDKIVPSAPEITSHVSAADSSLVTGQLQRRSPSPVEIPRETPVTKAAAPSSTPTYSPKKMSADEVSSTKDQSTPGCPFSPSALFDPKRLNPCVTQLVYWHEPKKSGMVFGSLLFLLLSMRFFSLISVVSYLALGALTFTLSFRIYKNILQAVQKANDGHPFKEYLEYDLNVPQDKVHDTADTLVKHVNCTLQKLRSLFLVEDLVDSIKLGIVLWSLTYLGAWFNGLTLIILGVVATFTFPKIYESNQTLIDQYLSLAGAQVSGVLSVVKSKIPFGKKEKSQ